MSDIKVRQRSRRFGFPILPHSPNLRSLGRGQGSRALATKTLPNPPHEGGTKSFGFKRPFLVTVSTVFTTLEILFHIQHRGLLEGVSRLNRAHKFPAHTLSPLDNINKIAHFLSGSNRCYYFPPSRLILPVEHGKTPEWRKSSGEKAFGAKIAVRHLKKVARISSLEFLWSWEVFGGKPKFIHDNKLSIRMNSGLAAAFLVLVAVLQHRALCNLRNRCPPGRLPSESMGQQLPLQVLAQDGSPKIYLERPFLGYKNELDTYSPWAIKIK